MCVRERAREREKERGRGGVGGEREKESRVVRERKMSSGPKLLDD
jgi:hypothetical protein